MSSAEIKDTIQSVQQFTAQMVKEMDDLKQLVGEQSAVNINAGEIFNKILDAARIANDVSRNMEHEIAYQRGITDEVKKALL